MELILSQRLRSRFVFRRRIQRPERDLVVFRCRDEVRVVGTEVQTEYTLRVVFENRQRLELALVEHADSEQEQGAVSNRLWMMDRQAQRTGDPILQRRKCAGRDESGWR